MKKAVLVVSFLGIFMPTNPMNALLQSLNPSRAENERGYLGAGFRKILKDLGYIDQDLLGLGDPTEKARTDKIYADLEAKPNDPHLQKQFTERQAKATQMALSLIAQLEDFSKTSTSDKTNNAVTSSSATSDTCRAFELIELSIDLRKLHAKKSLASAHASRLLRATNHARQRIKRILGVTDTSGNATQQFLLKEEPIFDQETIEAIPRTTIMERAIALITKSSDPQDPTETKLAQALLPLAPRKVIMAQALELLRTTLYDPDDPNELKIAHCRLHLVLGDHNIDEDDDSEVVPPATSNS